MAVCINKNSQEYQSLKSKAGIPELLLDAICSQYLDKYDRFPYLDELPKANSKPFLEEVLKLDKHNSTKISTILEYTNTNTIKEANIKLNDIHRDLETEIIPIVDEAIVKISNRPTDTDLNLVEKYTPDESVAHKVWTLQALNKLSNLYGINVIEITDADIKNMSDIMPKNRSVKAFIHNGQIYINLDRASVDSPVHELMHLLVGSLRFSNPQLYQNLIQSVENFPDYEDLILNHQNKTRNDANEEIFITEISKYLVGISSKFSRFSPKQIYEVDYNVRRLLDSMLMGDLSTKTIEGSILYRTSLKTVTELVNSKSMTNNFRGTFNEENSALHRKLNNRKAELIKEGKLKEVCR